MSEEFVELWAKQEDLISMHGQASAMLQVRIKSDISDCVCCAGDRESSVPQRFEEPIVLRMVSANVNGFWLASKMLQRAIRICSNSDIVCPEDGIRVHDLIPGKNIQTAAGSV